MNLNWTFLITQTENTASLSSMDVGSLILSAGPVVKLVLIILVVMSIVSWSIIFSKWILLKSAKQKSERFLNLYRASGNFGNLYTSTRYIGGPTAELFRAGYSEIIKIRKARSANNREDQDADNPDEVLAELGVVDLVERELKRSMSTETSKLEGSLIFLATTGSTAPFIGLFGTVWGIMTSFIGLAGGEGVPSLQVVAPGIAEALIATAIGLAAAIPAAVAYNYFISKVRRIDVEMENFAAEFLNVVERYLKKA
ncbi:MAG: protein TolQ [Thermodesulfobacteriota bacterium]